MIIVILSLIFIISLLSSLIDFCLFLLTFSVYKIKKKRKVFLVTFVMLLIISLLAISIRNIVQGPPKDIRVKGPVTTINLRCSWEKPIIKGQFAEYIIQTPTLYGLNFSPSLMLISPGNNYKIEGFMYRFDTATVCINNKSQQIPSITVTGYKSIK